MIEDHFKFPSTKEELLKLIDEYLDKHPGRVMEMNIQVGKPLVFKRLYVGGEGGEGLTTPYSILRRGLLEPLDAKLADHPLEVIRLMCEKLSSHSMKPICFLAWSKDVLKWAGCLDNILGYEVVVDAGLSKGTLILAGAKNKYAGPWGLEYGVRYVVDNG